MSLTARTFQYLKTALGNIAAATEISNLFGTPGTAGANQTPVLDANKAISGIGNLTLAGMLNLGSSTFASATSTVSSGTPLNGNGVQFVSANTTVNSAFTLPAASAGLVIPVLSVGGTSAAIAGVQNGTTINGGSANGTLSIPTGKGVLFIGQNSSSWRTIPLVPS